jgi:hypothetical protein
LRWPCTSTTAPVARSDSVETVKRVGIAASALMHRLAQHDEACCRHRTDRSDDLSRDRG